MPIHVELVTQERKVFEDFAVDQINVPGSEGEMGIREGHAAVLTTMTFGELIITKGDAEERFAIYGGVVDIRPNKVVVLADLAESSFGIDAERALEARERARQMMEEGVPDADNRQAVLELRRAELQLKLSSKVSNRGSMMRIIDQDDRDN